MLLIFVMTIIIYLWLCCLHLGLFYTLSLLIHAFLWLYSCFVSLPSFEIWRVFFNTTCFFNSCLCFQILDQLASCCSHCSSLYGHISVTILLGFISVWLFFKSYISFWLFNIPLQYFFFFFVCYHFSYIYATLDQYVLCIILSGPPYGSFLRWQNRNF